ncbi:protein phosphatase 1 regulatory inhibitor subunit 16B isoform X2 [Onthophagus taurus]|uniref:protein phosphatase 1 regulatory inhibitor subunit 16B isoform X2 n=1 Tax=Onthophagus taurus TaxID=166361 RepID=UPI0039BEC63D
MEHADLILEMSRIEQMPTQDRLLLAKERRQKQLQCYQRREKEYKKLSKMQKLKQRRIFFHDSVILLEAAARNDIEEVKTLLEKGVNPDSCNEDGLTALHQCCIDDNEAMLVLLLDYGANVNAVDSEKWTPLHAAATCGHIKLVRILIAKGANLLAVNADGNMPYDICEDEAALDYIEGEMAKRGVTQLLIDQTRAHTEMQMLTDLQAIAAVGGDLETYDKQGATPLHIASANGYITVVEFLLEYNVRTDVKDKDEWQPAHAAACWGHLDVLELLVQAGADLNAKNKHDETPADICEDPEIKERILQLRSEQETRRQAEAQRKRVRRSQSNTRAASVRRTSVRDKGLTQRRDAVEEARLRMQAENKGLDNVEGNQISIPTPPSTNGRAHTELDGNNVRGDSLELRKAPDGKDYEELPENNGDVVEFTINGNGTLADLKKQRMQIRNNSSSDVNSLSTPVSSMPEAGEAQTNAVTAAAAAAQQNADILRFTGDTEEVIGYSPDRGRRCCIIQ